MVSRDANEIVKSGRQQRLLYLIDIKEEEWCQGRNRISILNY